MPQKQSYVWPTVDALRSDKSAQKAAKVAAFESERNDHRFLVACRWIGAVHAELARAQSSVEKINGISVISPDGSSEASEFVRPLVITELQTLLPGVSVTEGGSFYYISLSW